MPTRHDYRTRSNNAVNPNKNICALEAARFFGCGDVSRYLHSIRDLVYAVRKSYTVRSRAGRVRGKTVGAARDTLRKLAGEVSAKGFLVRVNGHVLVLDATGKTVVDTSPRKRDRRKITHCYVVYR